MLTRILVCCLVHFISVLSVDGVYLSLNPSSMVIGSNTVNPSMSLNIQCSSNGTLDIDTLLIMKLRRRKFTEPTFTGIASMKFNGLAKLNSSAPSDIQIRSPNITGNVDTDLTSGTMTLSISAQGLTCGDQAEFQCLLTYLDRNITSQTVTDNMNFTVFIVPSEVIIDSPEYYINANTLQLSNNSMLSTGTRIKYRCTANVGSVPEGEILWERSSEMGTINSFITYTPTLSTDIVQDASRHNGCFYSRTSTMYYNLTKLDEDGISFRCRALTYLGGKLYDALSNQQYRAVAVDGVYLSLNPSSMVIGSNTVNPSMSLNIQCSSSGTLDIDTLIILRLSRRKFTEPTYVGIASMTFDGVAKLDSTAPSDIQNRSPNITGSVDVGQKSGTMTLSINAQGLTCGDQAEFQCALTYLDPNLNNKTVTDNMNFTVITVPSEVIIDSPEYHDIIGNTLQLSNNSMLITGTIIKYRCTANVGSVPEGEIVWERSLEMGTIHLFIPYTPTLSTDIVQEDSQQNGCFYRRISTMYYNLTKLDEDGISFRCRARTYLGGQLYDALSNQQYRAVAVNGVYLSLNPSSMVIGSNTVNTSMSLNIQCSSNGNLNVDALLLLKLSRRKVTEPTYVGIASMKFDGEAKLDSTAPSDIQNRSPNITGSFGTGQKSGTMTLSISAQGLTCGDQAEFQCALTYSYLNQINHTVIDNNNFTVIIVPSEVIIDSPEYYINANTLQLSNNSMLSTGTRIKYRCTANVGSVPEGEILWERSSEMGTINSFIPYTPTLSTDIVQDASRQNGCFYSRTSTMYYNLTKLDEDGISFRCRALTYLGGKLYDALSKQQYRAVAVNGVSLLLNPSSMVIGSNTVNTSMSLNIQCSSSGTLDVDTLFLLKLSRRKFTEPIYFGIAFMKFDGVAKLDPTALLDNQIRSSNITGSVDTGKKSGTMTLSLSTQGLACGDQAEFQCTFTYLDTNENIQTVSHIKNFTIITVPSEVIIDSPELYDISGNSLQLNNNSILPAGTRLKYRCTANIGSVPEGELIWERSLHIGSMNTFITYDPTRSTDIVQGSSQQDGCLYRRISTMYYNLTQLDVNGISFRCRARTYFGSQLYEALSNKQYRAVTEGYTILDGINISIAGDIYNGTSVDITCITTSVGNVTPSITWKYNGNDMNPVPDSRIRISTINGNIKAVTFHPILSSDSGTYDCVVMDGNSSPSVMNKTVIVISQPEVLIQPVTQTVDAGSTVSITCQVVNYVLKTKMVWYRDGTEINPTNKLSVESFSNGNTTLTHTFIQNTTKYECRGDNAAGQGNTRQAMIYVVLSGSHPGETCKNETDERRTKWSRTLKDTYDIKSCPAGMLGEAVRYCSTDGVWRNPSYDNCINETLLALQIMTDNIKNGLSPNTVQDSLANLTYVTSPDNMNLQKAEVQIVSIILDNVVQISNHTDNITNTEMENFLEIASNVIDVKNRRSWQALITESNEGASKILWNVEQYSIIKANSSNSPDGSVERFTKKNLFVEIGHTLVGGITFPSTTASGPALNNSSNSSFVLSQDALKQGNYTYSGAYFNNVKGIMQKFVLSNGSIINAGDNLEINSAVLSLQLYPQPPSLSPPLNLTFTHSSANYLNPTCRFWKFNGDRYGNGSWSDEGCNLSSTSDGTTVCQCDHLTNFAILMSPGKTPAKDQVPLSIISIIGCAISIFFLSVTMIAHLIVWRYVKSARSRLLMNLCAALIISYIIFLASVDRTENKKACTAVTALLHYFYLSVFFLMLAYGIEIAVSVIYVFVTMSRTRWLLPIAWILPAVIVAISLGVTKLKGYGTRKFCWLSIEDGLIWAFIGPAALVILLNVIIIIVVLHRKFSSSSMMTKSNKVKARAAVRSLCVLLPITGITWVFGILSVNEDLVVFQYLFAIINSLQGLLVFMFHCIFNHHLKKAIKQRNASRKRSQVSIPKTLTSSSNRSRPRTCDSLNANQQNKASDLEASSTNSLLESNQQMQTKVETYAEDNQLNTSNEYAESNTNNQDKMCGYNVCILDVKISNNLDDTMVRRDHDHAQVATSSIMRANDSTSADIDTGNSTQFRELEPKRRTTIRVRKAKDITRAKKYRKAKERSLHYQYFDMADMSQQIYHVSYAYMPRYVSYNPYGGAYAYGARWKSTP